MKKLITVLGILVVLIVIFALYFLKVAWFSDEESGDPVTIVVGDEMTPSEVRDLLVESGLVASPIIYDLFSKIDKSPLRPKAGEYTFRKGASLQVIADEIALGPQRDELTVRFVEGKIIDENAEALRTHGVDPTDYWALTGRSKNLLEFDRSLEKDFGFLKDIPSGQSLEGYLFPDTYNIWKDQLPEGLIRKQLRTFANKVIIPYEDERRVSNMTWHEVLTLASIVEAEVKTAEDRKIVAGIFLNRLNGSMRIQSDATINYIVGEGRMRATREDLQLDSPYNSYRRDGLPPGPINNPSLSSITAVLNYTETDYIFFLTDEEGKIYYAETLDGHQRNRVEAYGS
jgi:UPF0755 protein